jgi:hypothetical protein
VGEEVGSLVGEEVVGFCVGDEVVGDEVGFLVGEELVGLPVG